jgi:hypothetical protein
MHAYEMHAHETHAREMHAHETPAHGIHTCEMHDHEVHVYETHTYQMHVHQMHDRLTVTNRPRFGCDSQARTPELRPQPMSRPIVSPDTPREAGTNTVKIEEFNIETAKRMVEFLHTKAYDNPTEEQGSEGVSGSETTKARTAEILLGHIRVSVICRLLRYTSVEEACEYENPARYRNQLVSTRFLRDR